MEIPNGMTMMLKALGLNPQEFINMTSGLMNLGQQLITSQQLIISQNKCIIELLENGTSPVITATTETENADERG